MTAVADTPASTAPPVPPVRVRRPRMRRPAHEPEPAAVVPAIPGPRPAVATAGSALRPGPGDDLPDPPRPPHPDDDLRRHAAATVRAMVEVLAGRRAAAHLAGVARPAVVRYLTASRTTGPGAPVPPSRVHVSRPTGDAAEVVAVCRFGSRSRALAVRLDRAPRERGHAWWATAVRVL